MLYTKKDVANNYSLLPTQFRNKKEVKNLEKNKDWAEILAAEWYNFGMTKGMRFDSLVTMGIDIQRAATELNSTQPWDKQLDEEEAMRLVFDFIQVSEYWGNFLATPSRLMIKRYGVTAVRECYNEATNLKKNRNKIFGKRLKDEMISQGLSEDDEIKF